MGERRVVGISRGVVIASPSRVMFRKPSLRILTSVHHDPSVTHIGDGSLLAATQPYYGVAIFQHAINLPLRTKSHVRR
jgi:hypothetical protein